MQMQSKPQGCHTCYVLEARATSHVLPDEAPMVSSLLQVRKLFQQLFSFVNVQLFNQLLLRRECCSFSNGEYVKTGLAEVENWIHSAGKDWTGESWDELRYIRQVCLLSCFLKENLIC